MVGAASLGSEIAAARLMAPFFGASTIIWANTIGVVLVALSIGYFLGGRIADRRPEVRSLCVVVLAAAVLLAIVPLIARPFFDISVDALDEVAAGAFIGSLLAVLLSDRDPDRAAGHRRALGDAPGGRRRRARGPHRRAALRDLDGRFAHRHDARRAGADPVRRDPADVSDLRLRARPGRDRRSRLALRDRAGRCSPGRSRCRWAPSRRRTAAGSSSRTSPSEQYIRVIDQDDGDRILELNEGQAVHSILPRRGYLTADYWDSFLVLPFAARSEPPRRIAILGNAAGTIARQYGHFWPDTYVDGVEIDAELSDVGYRYFDMGSNPRLTIHDDDARPWLRRADDEYDLIVVDAYRQPYIPFYLTTEEFFELIADRLVARRRRRCQRRPPGGRRRVRAQPRPDDGGGLPERPARSSRADQHAADRRRRAALR